MADEIGRPKVTLILDKDQAEKAIKDLKSAGSDTGAALESSLGASIDATTKRIRRLADELSGASATKKLQELEKAVASAGGASKLSGAGFDMLAQRVQNLVSQGGTA